MVQFETYCTLWGVWSPEQGVDKFVETLKRAKQAGYSGIEMPVAFVVLLGAARFRELMQAHQLKWIAQVFTSGPAPTPAVCGAASQLPGVVHAADDTADAHNVQRHEEVFEAQLREVAALADVVQSVTSHTGKDYFTVAEADRLLAFCESCARTLDLGGRVHHETHRSRILYSPWVTRDVCARHANLTLVADYSHFTCVAEARPTDPELGACVRALNARVRHVHARVGFEEGPQVPDPRAPAWQQHHAEFQVWWQHAYAAALARGDALVTTTPEHGPPPYCWVLPNGEPIADMWAVNAFVGDACKHTFDECVAADVSASLAAVHRAFPGAQDQAFVVPRVNAMLAAHGFTPANTLFAHSVCADEINHEKGDITEQFASYWGEVFALGGLGGLPFAGKTGWVAFSHHVTYDGNVLVLFAPHVGISPTGELGRFRRHGQHHISSACGAALGGYKAALARATQLAAGHEELNKKHDVEQLVLAPNDYQMQFLIRKLTAHALEIQSAPEPLAALAFAMYEEVKSFLDKIVSLNFGPGKLALLGGIQINMPGSDHFLPLSFEIQQLGRQTINLLPAMLTTTVPLVLAAPVHAHTHTHAHGAGSADDDEIDTADSVASVRRAFPLARTQVDVCDRANALLAECGFTAENTLFAHSVCSDEINHEHGDITQLMAERWGGFAFCGQTGFVAFSHHVPDNGNVFILFAPHVGIAPDGTIGKYRRHGQDHDSTACGAAVGGLRAALARAQDIEQLQQQNGNQYSSEQAAMSPYDFQMAFIISKLVPHAVRINAAPEPMAALALAMFDEIKAFVKQIVSLNFGSGKLCLLGGIQINMPGDDFFLPLHFEVEQLGQPTHDLLPQLQQHWQ